MTQTHVGEIEKTFKKIVNTELNEGFAVEVKKDGGNVVIKFSDNADSEYSRERTKDYITGLCR